MSSPYTPIPHTMLDAGTGYQRPRQNLPDRIDCDAPALQVMTDLSKVAAITIDPHTNLEEAQKHMIACGIRLLLVTNGDEQIQGILTSRDLDGDKAVALLSNSGLTRRELTVHDIMTPRHRIEVLEMNDIANARVGDVVETLKRMGRQHALVVDRDHHDKQTVRGILSVSQIARQIGKPIEVAGMDNGMSGLMHRVANEHTSLGMR